MGRRSWYTFAVESEWPLGGRSVVGVRRGGRTAAPTYESEPMADFIEGKRPVIEALRTHVPLKYILMADNLSQADSIVRDIQRKAKNLDVPIKKVSKKKLDEISERGSHQGVMAEAAPFDYVNVTTIRCV